MWHIRKSSEVVYRRASSILSILVIDTSLTHFSRILIFGKYKLSTPTLLYALIPSGIDGEAPRGVFSFILMWGVFYSQKISKNIKIVLDFLLSLW